MSEIPYVKQLGDAFDEAIARRARSSRLRRLGRRRYLAVALAALTVAGGGAALAEMLTDPAELGFRALACFDGSEPKGGVAVFTDVSRSPVQACVHALPSGGLAPSELIACGWRGGIAVMRRDGRGNCAARGLTAVPPEFTRWRIRARQLDRMVLALERKAGCLAPRRLARRLQVALDAGHWAGWRAVARGGEGPCGRLSGLGGGHLRTIAGNVRAARRVVMVRAGISLGLERFLYGPSSPGSRLFQATGKRCFTVAELKDHVTRVLAAAGRLVRFRVNSLPENQGLGGARGRRYLEGCAVSAGPVPAFPDGRTVIVGELLQRDSPPY